MKWQRSSRSSFSRPTCFLDPQVFHAFLMVIPLNYDLAQRVNLSQMGELVRKLDDQFIKEHTSIPWNQIRGLRNRIVHDYEGVNLILIWDVIKIDLPELKKQLLDI